MNFLKKNYNLSLFEKQHNINRSFMSKTISKIIIFGCLTLALVLTSCSKEDEPTPLTIGDFLKGGVIFYLDDTKQHGLVCAVSNQSDGTVWGCIGTTINGADDLTIGTGLQNTLDIEVGCTTAGTAADLCANLTLNTYSDWFLPSQDELYEMYLNKDIIDITAIANGGTAFDAKRYWSSTEFSDTNAWYYPFYNAAPEDNHKSSLYRVRAVRAF